MTTLRTCLNYLDSQSVRYVHTTHSPAFTAQEVAAAEHMHPHRMSKTVVFRSNEGYLMVVVPANSHVDPEQVRIAVGGPDLRKADENELSLLFPLAETGAMPPLGVLFGLPVYLDRKVASLEFIAFNAGTHKDVIHMSASDFIRLVKPVLGDFRRPEYDVTYRFVAAHYA